MTQDISIKVKDFLTREKWCRYYPAMNANGKVVAITSPEATCWCLIGAIRLIYKDPDEINIVVNKLYKTLHEYRENWRAVANLSLPSVNDIGGYPVVKALLEKADV